LKNKYIKTVINSEFIFGIKSGIKLKGIAMAIQAGSFELNYIQYDIIQTLVILYKQRSSAIRADEVAKIINRHPGTVRNHMQILKTLGVVEGVPGPKGGYLPTIKAYEFLEIKGTEESVSVPVFVNEELIGSVEEIVFHFLSHSKVCQAKVRVLGNIKKVKPADDIFIGPIPVNRLVIHGKTIGREDTSNTLIIDIEEMEILNEDE